MNSPLSDRVQRIKPSPTIAVSAKARQLKLEGRPVVDLGIGEPDFDTPEPIKQACIDALAKNLTHYPAVDGTAELKQAIMQKLANENQLSVQADQLLVSTGAKQSLYNACQALLSAGDECIIPAPYWVSYPAMVELADAKPVLIRTNAESQYKLTADQLDAAMTPSTKLIIFNSPSNPTGMIYREDELIAIADVLRQHPQIIIISDDIYEKIIWQGEKVPHILQVAPDLANRTLIINGVSKAYAMTGWRIGYAAGPAEIIAGMKKVQSQSTSGANALAQYAAAVAISGDQSCVETMRAAFEERYHTFFNALNGIEGFKCLPTQGAFYLFPNIEQAIQLKGLASDIEFADALLTQAEVATVAGSAFGSPGHLRLSFAADLATLEQAIERISQFMKH